jgi:hypothetical protein
MKRGVVHSLYHRATAISQEPRDHSDKIDILRHTLHLSAYPTSFIDSVMSRSKRSDCLKKEVQPLGFITMNCISGVSKELKSIASRYNIRTVFKTRPILRSSLMQTRPNRAPQETAFVSMVVPVSVEEAALEKQADHGL